MDPWVYETELKQVQEFQASRGKKCDPCSVSHGVAESNLKAGSHTVLQNRTRCEMVKQNMKRVPQTISLVAFHFLPYVLMHCLKGFTTNMDYVSKR